MTTELELDVRNPSGLHARPAALFVKAACGFASDIRVSNLTTGSREVPAKSIIGILGLGVEPGHRIRVRIEGVDEHRAAAALRDLVTSGLGEPPADEAERSTGEPAPATGGAAPSADGAAPAAGEA
ncbi:MAG TPA: HPr family phosphocarrier protein [Candidatus Limnocylindrales bacterium]|nr:HPr family phosphocarrier protein [Candidatus Limnocylindrales bacterium]